MNNINFDLQSYHTLSITLEEKIIYVIHYVIPTIGASLLYIFARIVILHMVYTGTYSLNVDFKQQFLIGRFF